MHPLNSHHFGVHGIAVQFYNGSSVVTGYIVKQISANTFKVTDGTNNRTCKLAPTTAIATALSSNPTYFTIAINPTVTTASGATFTPTYAVSQAAIVTSPSNFNVGDSLALPSGSGALTVATLSGSQIATVTVGTAGAYTSTFSSPTTATRAAGTGATFTAHYGVQSATIVGGGSGSSASYHVNDVLTLSSSGGATITVNTIDGGGGILTFTVSAPGTVTALLANPVATTGGNGTGATFTLKYYLLSVTSSGGSGYNVGDSLIFGSLVATTAPTATITTATSHAATTVTVGSGGTGITTAASAITTSTTTATFKLGYTLSSVATSGGTGYTTSMLLDFGGLSATVRPVASISSVSSGVPTAITVGTAGTNITTGSPASSITAYGATQYVSHITHNKVTTTAGNVYNWGTNSQADNAADILSYS